MGENAHLSTWISDEEKQRFTAAAARQGLSASAFLKRLIEQVLAAGADNEPQPSSMPAPPRDTRLTIRLVAEDHTLLAERAAARTMPPATYVSSLIRAHLRQVTPLPDKELVELKSAVNQLAVLGRNLNIMTRLLHQGSQQAVPGRDEVHTMLRICDGLRDHFRALIKANLISWQVGHDTKGH